MNVLSSATLKVLCERAGMRPEKSSGQNFLTSRAVLDRIIAAVDPQPTDTIIEVGAGFGVLTTALASRVARVIAIERDRRIAAVLRKIVSGEIPRFARNDEKGESELVAGYGNVEVVEEDVLRWLRGDHAACVIARSETPKQSRPSCTYSGIASVAPLPRNDTTQSWKLAANLPYSITSDFLHLLFDRVADGSLPPPERAVLLLQREVVDRLCADPAQQRDHRNVGMLTIITQLHCTPHRAAIVAPGSFWPAPKVESAVVVLDHWRTPAELQEFIGGPSRAELLALVHACFVERRRQLISTLQHYTKHPRAEIERCGALADIDPTARPEMLTLMQLVTLNRALRS